MNKYIGIGRLTADPIVTTSTGDTAVLIARFKLAINRGRDAGADFIPVIAFNKNAEFARDYLKKGLKIVVLGRLQTGSYEKDGVKYYTFEIVANEFEFCEKKRDDAEQERDPNEINPFIGLTDEDIPFL